MDYKEKYKQALKIAQETYNTQPMYKEWLEKMFPELKESEDECIEKIKKDIISYLNNRKIASIAESSATEKWLTWLKKQGEQKSIDDLTPQEAMDIAVAKCFEQGEQNPVIEMKSAEESLGIDSDTYNKIIDECIFGEQKPAWSEEEERYICQLESMVKEKWALAEKAQDEEVIKNMSNLAFFLKTLNPNKKLADEEMKTLLRTEYEKGRADVIAEMQMEWSEEDEIYYKRVQLSIEWARAHNRISEGSCDEQLNWLKSLKGRVQPKQKWSEEDEETLG